MFSLTDFNFLVFDFLGNFVKLGEGRGGEGKFFKGKGAESRKIINFGNNGDERGREAKGRGGKVGECLIIVLRQFYLRNI